MPGVPRCRTKNLGPIGLAVLTFIGYKQTDRQTNRQTDKPNLYIEGPKHKTIFKNICEHKSSQGPKIGEGNYQSFSRKLLER